MILSLIRTFGHAATYVAMVKIQFRVAIPGLINCARVSTQGGTNTIPPTALVAALMLTVSTGHHPYGRMIPYHNYYRLLYLKKRAHYSFQVAPAVMNVVGVTDEVYCIFVLPPFAIRCMTARGSAAWSPAHRGAVVPTPPLCFRDICTWLPP